MSKLKKSKRLRIPKTHHEDFLREKGFEVICGLDEVGRGAWAGPLVAAAVILPSPAKIKTQNPNVKRIYNLRDSKLLTAKEREKIAKKIKKRCLWGIGEVSVEEINKWKLTKSTQKAFSRAVKKLRRKPDFILADGFEFVSSIPCRAIKKGDMVCASIAAASIIAKVYRDKLMRQLDREIKGYYFSQHKGYGTRLHRQCLKKLGPSKVHRMFYKSLIDNHPLD
jgi:ribonuclease HII